MTCTIRHQVRARATGASAFALAWLYCGGTAEADDFLVERAMLVAQLHQLFAQLSVVLTLHSASSNHS